MDEGQLKRLPLRHLMMRRRAAELISQRTAGPQASDYEVHCHNVGLWIRGHGWAHVAAGLKASEKAPTGFLEDLLGICAAAEPVKGNAALPVEAQLTRLLSVQQTPVSSYLLQARLALQAADVMKEVAAALFAPADEAPAEESDHA